MGEIFSFGHRHRREGSWKAAQLVGYVTSTLSPDTEVTAILLCPIFTFQYWNNL
jgi:hypothetical protein